jgi:hypothetical protein
VRWKVFSVLPAMSSYTRGTLSLGVVRRWYSVTRSGDIVGETNASESTSVELALCVTSRAGEFTYMHVTCHS